MAVTGKTRLKQEILLGIGGVLLLKRLGIKKDIYHCNEGHAALCNVQRLCEYVEGGLSFDEALEVVRASSLYTVHTPVPQATTTLTKVCSENIWAVIRNVWASAGRI